MPSSRLIRTNLAALTLTTCLCAGLPAASAQSTARKYAGRPLADAIQDLQAQGLRVVFTTAIVNSRLRVVAEPRARSRRGVLDRLDSYLFAGPVFYLLVRFVG